MSDRIDPPDRRLRTRSVAAGGQPVSAFDHGWSWCINAVAHPGPDGSYPDPERHRPWHECRSREAFVDDVRRDLDGEPAVVSVYNAAAFRFGQLRDDAPPAVPRVVIEAWSSGDEPARRVSLTAGEALRLARILVRCADELTFGQRAA